MLHVSVKQSTKKRVRFFYSTGHVPTSTLHCGVMEIFLHALLIIFVTCVNGALMTHSGNVIRDFEILTSAFIHNTLPSLVSF